MSDEITRIEIDGDAGAATAAAVTAVIAEILHEEAIQRALPKRRPRPSAWASATRPKGLELPLPSESYELVQWGFHTGESPVSDEA